MNVDMALRYRDFVVQRHQIWSQRQAGAPAPWASDPILQTFKFTNVFRVLDAGSQYLLTQLLTGDDVDWRTALMRSYLYRITNLPGVWEYTHQQLGRYPRPEDLGEGLVDMWEEFRAAGHQVFSGAYIVRPQPATAGVSKVYSVVHMARRLFHPDSPTSLLGEWEALDGPHVMSQRFELLRAQPGIGNFIAMQVLTDFGYSPHGHDQDENRFVVPGPGCLKGVAELERGEDPVQTLVWAHQALLADPECPVLDLGGGGLRTPSLMDIQNTFCEFSKYARHMRKPVPARTYSPAHPGPQPEPVYPVHWE